VNSILDKAVIVCNIGKLSVFLYPISSFLFQYECKTFQMLKVMLCKACHFHILIFGGQNLDVSKERCKQITGIRDVSMEY
jgi:hypothetical protein